jgi:amidohydrolase
MLDDAQELKPRLVELRRTIHRQPELGFEVHRTAELVARTLGELGVEAQTGVGKTGVVGYLGEADGPVVAIRADMDALPIQESNEVDYASQVPGQMHACGHDAHTAMLMGVAMLLAKRPLPGQVRLIFQPSEEAFDEEGVSGATRMIDDGALQGVDAVIALHVNGRLEAGTIAVEAGQASAAVDDFKAYVRGKGGHAARPHATVDANWLATQVLNALYGVPSRRINPFAPAVLTVGIIRGGTASNVIPDSVYIEGTLRSRDDEVRAQLIEEVERCLEIARALGGDYDLTIEHGYPSLMNDAGVTAEIQAVARDLLGPNGLGEARPMMGAEDFAYMTRLAPGAMFSLGTRRPGGRERFVHAPDFDIDESALPVGAAMLAETAVRLLKKHGRG